MRREFSISKDEIGFFIVTAMIFVVCSVLSIQLNYFFIDVKIFGFVLPFNISVVFFCLGFFIIDLVTELYNPQIANYYIYAKVISQLIFIILGNIGVKFSGMDIHGDLARTFSAVPYVLMCSVIASIVGYRLTSKLMQHFKVRFRGKFLFSRYLFSTLPGEIVFSLVFSSLTFSIGRSFLETINVFVGLTIVKVVLSLIFSVSIVPITNLAKYFLRGASFYENTEISLQNGF